MPQAGRGLHDMVAKIGGVGAAHADGGAVRQAHAVAAGPIAAEVLHEPYPGDRGVRFEAMPVPEEQAEAVT